MRQYENTLKAAKTNITSGSKGILTFNEHCILDLIIIHGPILHVASHVNTKLFLFCSLLEPLLCSEMMHHSHNKCLDSRFVLCSSSFSLSVTLSDRTQALQDLYPDSSLKLYFCVKCIRNQHREIQYISKV